MTDDIAKTRSMHGEAMDQSLRAVPATVHTPVMETRLSRPSPPAVSRGKERGEWYWSTLPIRRHLLLLATFGVYAAVSSGPAMNRVRPYFLFVLGASAVSQLFSWYRARSRAGARVEGGRLYWTGWFRQRPAIDFGSVQAAYVATATLPLVLSRPSRFLLLREGEKVHRLPLSVFSEGDQQELIARLREACPVLEEPDAWVARELRRRLHQGWLAAGLAFVLVLWFLVGLGLGAPFNFAVAAALLLAMYAMLRQHRLE